LFDKFDRHEKAKLNKEDLRMGISSFKKITEEEVKNLMKYIDKSHEGTISLKEFRAAFFSLDEKSLTSDYK